MTTANEIIQETFNSASEWIEMSSNPEMTLCIILAQKIVKLHDHIEYLERRLKCQQNPSK